MNKEQVVRQFIIDCDYESINVVKARIKDGTISKEDVRYNFLTYLDTLCKNGTITEKQYNTWTCPSWMY